LGDVPGSVFSPPLKLSQVVLRVQDPQQVDHECIKKEHQSFSFNDPKLKLQVFVNDSFNDYRHYCGRKEHPHCVFGRV
jgi:hypothetical protein